MKLAGSVLLGLALASASLTVSAQDEAPAAAHMAASKANPVSVVRLRGGAYWVSGGTSNSGFVVGKTGVIVIDAQMSPDAARQEQAEIAKITPLPINVLVLTHSDPDHINGLPSWPANATIVAQVNANRDMRRVVTYPNSNGAPPPADIVKYLPNHTVGITQSLAFDHVPVVFLHLSPAHTDGDIAVYLPHQRVVFGGDLMVPTVAAYPGVHLNKNGSSAGWIRMTKAMLMLDADTYISGHGEAMTKAEVRQRLASAERRRDDIHEMVAENMTLPEIKAALHEPQSTGSRFPTFTETTYTEITEPR